MTAALGVLLLAGFSEADEVTLSQALSEANAHAPEQFAARAHTNTAQAQILSARALPSTLFSVGGGFDDPTWSAGIAQRFQPWGVRSSRVEAAENSASAARLEMVQTAASIRARTRRAFYASMHHEQLVALSSRTVELARTAESAAKARFETGVAPRLDVVQAGLARAALQALQTTREAERDVAAVELALLLGRDPSHPLVPRDPGLPPPRPELAQVLAAAQDGPLAQARTAEVAAAKASLQAARAARLPGALLGASVESNRAVAGQSSAQVALRGSLELELPLIGFNRGEISVASAQLVEAEVRRDNDARARSAAIVAAYQRLTAALKAAERYQREILPAAAEVERMGLDAYRGGKTPLAALLEAQRAAAETRERSVESDFDAQDAFSQLESAAGVPLDAR